MSSTSINFVSESLTIQPGTSYKYRLYGASANNGYYFCVTAPSNPGKDQTVEISSNTWVTENWYNGPEIIINTFSGTETSCSLQIMTVGPDPANFELKLASRETEEEVVSN